MIDKTDEAEQHLVSRLNTPDRATTQYCYECIEQFLKQGVPGLLINLTLAEGVHADFDFEVEAARAAWDYLFEDAGHIARDYGWAMANHAFDGWVGHVARQMSGAIAYATPGELLPDLDVVDAASNELVAELVEVLTAVGEDDYADDDDDID